MARVLVTDIEDTLSFIKIMRRAIEKLTVSYLSYLMKDWFTK